MTEQDKIRLAEWAGFRQAECYLPDIWLSPNDPDRGCVSLGDMHLYELPDFPNDLSACFKWLVPELQDRGYMVELLAHEHRGFSVTIRTIFQSVREPEEYYEPVAKAKGDNPALALYEAILKLIKEEV